MFKLENLLAGQSQDMSQYIVDVKDVKTPFLDMMLGKSYKAESDTVYWMERELDPTSVQTIKEGGTAVAHVNDNLGQLDNYLELITATVSVSDTMKNSTITGIANPIAQDIANKTKSIKRYTENKLIYGTKAITSGVKYTNGVVNIIDSTNKVTTTSLTGNDVEQLMSKLYDVGLNDNMIVFCNAYMKQKVNALGVVTHLARDNSLGFDADVYTSAFGDVRFVDVPNMKKEDMLLLNPDYARMPQVIPFQIKALGTVGSSTEYMLQHQVGTRLDNKFAGAFLTVTP